MRLSNYLSKNKYIDTTIQKGGISGMTQPMLQQVYKIKTIIKKAVRTRQSMVILFLDISNAFGNLSLPVLYQIMEKYHINTQFISYLKSFYSSFEYYVQSKEWTTEMFKWDNGLVQGCPMSPLLFVLALNYVLVHVNNLYKDRCGYVINPGNKILLLAYMDDICLICRNRETLVEVYQQLETELKLLNLPINQSKSTIMFINEQDLEENKILPDFTRVDTSKYLGEIISNTGDNNSAYAELLKTLGRRLSGIDKRTLKNADKIAVFDQYLLPYLHRRFTMMYDMTSKQKIYVANLVNRYMTLWERTDPVQLFNDSKNGIVNSDDGVINNMTIEDTDDGLEKDIDLSAYVFTSHDISINYDTIKEDANLDNIIENGIDRFLEIED